MPDSDTPQRLKDRLATLITTRRGSTDKHRGVNERHEPRKPVFTDARVVVAGGRALKCIILDLSPNGARIEIEDAENLPDHVLLKTNSDGEARRARVAWRRANMAGLSFVVIRRAGFSNQKS